MMNNVNPIFKANTSYQFMEKKQPKKDDEDEIIKEDKHDRYRLEKFQIGRRRFS